MDNSKIINFNGNLIENKTCEITYSGMFFENNSDSVTIVYGFDDDWKESSEKVMQKTDSGFKAEIKMLNYNSFNFCFRNSNYEWDNNFYQNYAAPITRENVTPTFTNDEEISIVTNDVIENAVDNVYNANIDKIATTEGLGLENIIEDEENNTTPVEDISDFSVEVEKNDALNIEESLVNSVELSEVNVDLNDDDQDTVIETENNQEFSMNSLIDEILSPIVSSSIFEEEPVQEVVETIVENPEIVVEPKEEAKFTVQENLDEISDDEMDSLIDGLITSIYKNIDNHEAEITNQPSILEIVNEDKVPDSPENIVNSEVTSIDTVFDDIEPNEEEKSLAVSNRVLTRFYMIKKKIKLAFMKLAKIFSTKGSTSTNNLD